MQAIGVGWQPPRAGTADCEIAKSQEMESTPKPARVYALWMEPEGWLTQRNIEPAKTSALEGSGLKILRGFPDADASIEDRDPGRTHPPRANRRLA